MKKVMRIVALLVITFGGVWAYTSTSQDQQLLDAVYVKIDEFVSSHPTLRSALVQKISEIKNIYATNERLTWFLDQISSRYATTLSPMHSCTIFPSDNPRNTDISRYPVHPNSANYIASIGATTKLHPDFGANRDGGPFGIPYVIVGKDTPLVPVTATWYPDESDQGNRPVPVDAPIEKGSDHHVIAVDMDACMLYELYAAEKTTNGWNAGSSAKFDMKSNALRPEKRTSADAAGLPIYPGLARYDEVVAGEINHALRFTVSRSQKAYIHPATHYASSSTDPNLPPMGLRVRLKADFDISRFTGQAKVILTALKKYGMIVADNGSNRYISGAPDARRDDDDLGQLKTIPGSAFEVVDTGPLVK